MGYMESLESLEQMITEARSVPLSSSAMVSREDILALITEIRAALPAEHQQAREVMDEREKILTEAHEQASFIKEQAREERSRLLSRAEVVQAAEEEANRVVMEAHTKAGELANQADDYVDKMMADVEIILNKLLRTIAKGRERLQQRLEAHTGPIEPLNLDDSGEISGPMQSIS